MPTTSAAIASETRTQKVRFGSRGVFSKTLKERVDTYFEEKGISRRGDFRLYFKTVFFFASLVISYSLMVFAPIPTWAALICAVAMGVSMTGIGFNIMHDGGHQSYSKHGYINKLMAYSSDLVGASSYVWNCKHNHLHHTYTNIEGYDDDLSAGFFARLAPGQRRLRIHRFQHFYMWFLYGVLPSKWHVWDDFYTLITSRVGPQEIAFPRRTSLFMLFFGKVFFFGWALVLPSFYHPFWLVLCFYLLATFVEGVLLSVVFQLAHCMEEADFPVPENDAHRLEAEWSVHQVLTTVDFARNNRLASWFCGGLNFQVEHHLFPKISHIHYPALAQIVENTCAEFNVRYSAHNGIFSSIRSHYRFLREMGRPLPAYEGHCPESPAHSFSSRPVLRRRNKG